MNISKSLYKVGRQLGRGPMNFSLLYPASPENYGIPDKHIHTLCIIGMLGQVLNDLIYVDGDRYQMISNLRSDSVDDRYTKITDLGSPRLFN